MPFRNIRDGISMSTWQRQRLAFEVGLDLLIRDGKANLLADSKVATMNNREAKIHIGEKIPYVVSTITATGVVTKSIMKEHTGVKLTLTPHVNESGDITVTLAPEVSSIIGWRGENQDIPLVKTREATSTVRVKDGQKIFLAGLLSEEISHDLDKVPLLGSIPVLGRLFQRRVDVKNKTNLIIEVTPRIIYQ
jgi:type II secretory pathway component GspD/PulD (secretin)